MINRNDRCCSKLGDGWRIYDKLFICETGGSVDYGHIFQLFKLIGRWNFKNLIGKKAFLAQVWKEVGGFRFRKDPCFLFLRDLIFAFTGSVFPSYRNPCFPKGKPHRIKIHVHLGIAHLVLLIGILLSCTKLSVCETRLWGLRDPCSGKHDLCADLTEAISN